MKINQIKVTPFEFQSVISYESTIEINEHGQAKVTGYASREQAEKAMDCLSGEGWATVSGSDEAGPSHPLFCGIVTGGQAEQENNTYIVTIVLKTGTFLMDLKEHIRVFQRGSYQVLQDACMESYREAYAESKYLMAIPDELTGGLVVQYRETDWEFARRLAGQKNTVLIPNEKSPGVKYIFGVSGDAAGELSSYESYMSFRDMGGYRRRKENGFRGGAGSGCQVRSREVFFVGDSVGIRGKTNVVTRLRREWSRKELWNQYTLTEAGDIWQETYYNPKIIGASLKGKVSEVSRDKVRITVLEDENNNRTGSRWFAYATVYSSPDGTGWYCMPEEGDYVQLQFPCEDEKDAYVSSSVNEKPTDPEARSNKDHKSIKNKDGKEILMTPETLVLTNNKGMTITIDDAVGITIESDKDITLNAAGGVSLVSEQSALEMQAAGQLRLQQGTTSIELAEQIALTGAQLNMQ